MNDDINSELLSENELNNDVENIEVESEELLPEVQETEAESDESDSSEQDEIELFVDGKKLESKPPAKSGWVGELREKYQEANKRAAELERKLAEVTKVHTAPLLDAGKKPNIEDYDDVYTFNLATDAWIERKLEVEANKRELEERKRKQEAADRELRQAYEQKVASHHEKGKQLGVKGFDNAEAFVSTTFNDVQKALMIQGLNNSALVYYALNADTEQAAKFAKMTDPIQFLSSISKFEEKLKMTSRKQTTKAESTLSGGSSNFAGSHKKELNRLRDEADRTGDHTKVVRYIQSLKTKGINPYD